MAATELNTVSAVVGFNPLLTNDIVELFTFVIELDETFDATPPPL